MSIIKKTIDLTILKAENPACLQKITLENLAINGIQPLAGADDKSSGFVPMNDPYDTAWKGQGSHPAIGEYLAFALRVDAKRIAPALFKKHYEEAKAKELEDKRKEEGADGRLSKTLKKEIKERVKMRLLAKTEAVPASHVIVVNPNSGIVYLASCSGSIITAVKEKFASCLGCELVATGESLDFDQEKSRNFLTDIVLDRTDFAPTGQITVTDSTDDTRISAFSKSDSDIAEIRDAVNSGKKVIKTGLTIEQDGESCTMNLTSTFVISGLKLPVQEDKEGAKNDPDAQFLERMFLIEKYTGMVFEAYSRY